MIAGLLEAHYFEPSSAGPQGARGVLAERTAHARVAGGSREVIPRPCHRIDADRPFLADALSEI